MLIRKIQIWPDRDDVTLSTYLHDDSPEIAPGQNRPALLIFPGGGYLGTSDREGEPVALRFAAMGYQAFVLRYATLFRSYPTAGGAEPIRNAYPSQFPQPIYDAAAAIRLIRQYASDWQINPNQIAACGFSAGGHLAASLATMWQEPFLLDRLGGNPADFRPDAMILGYPVIDYALTARMQAAAMATLPEPDQGLIDFLGLCEIASFGRKSPSDEQRDHYNPARFVTDQTPPAFIWATSSDRLVPVANAINFAARLQAEHVPLELHVFTQGPHGLSLADETTAAHPSQISPAVAVWPELAQTWLKHVFTPH